MALSQRNDLLFLFRNLAEFLLCLFLNEQTSKGLRAYQPKRTRFRALLPRCKLDKGFVLLTTCPPNTDEQLLARMADGEEDALNAFYARHAPYIYGLLLKLLAVREDAEDVLQKIFWQAWGSAARFDSERGSVRAWLVLIARSRARDQFRRKRALLNPVHLADTDIEDPATICAKDEDDSVLHRALQQVPSEQRSAIALAFFDGMTYEEVAREQTVPLGTVKTRIRAGLQRLRDLLGEERQAPS